MTVSASRSSRFVASVGALSAFLLVAAVAGAQADVPDGPAFANPGFESPQLTSFSYAPAGSGWSFTNNAGVQHNGSAYSGSLAAVEGTQTAFVQGVGGKLGTMSQKVTFPAGTFAIGFQSARRYGTVQPVLVSVDDTPLGIYAPPGAGFAATTTGAFTVMAGDHTVTFAATDGSADRSAFLDAMTISRVGGAATPSPPSASATPASTPTATATPTPSPTPSSTPSASPPTTGSAGTSVALVNPSFESPSLGSYSTAPAGSSWTFSGSAGIQHNGSAYSGSTAAPDGTQTAFLQGLKGALGAMSQTAVFPAGTFTIGFDAARRYGTVQPVAVSVDGRGIGTYTPAGSTFGPTITTPFTVAAGSHTITLTATDSSADRSTFVDAISVNSGSPTVPAAGNDIDLSGYGLTFSDEFSQLSASATTPKSSSTWYSYPPYGSASNYSASTWNVAALSVSNGILSNRAYRGSNPGTAGNYWNSGNLSSVDTTGAGFSQQYGYFEARVRMPDSGTGAWPAFWLSTTNSIPTVSTAPVKHAEIDIFEWYGATHTTGADYALVQQASHNWNADGRPNEAAGSYLYAPQTAIPGGGLPWTAFHTYGVRIDPSFVTWYIDGVQTNRIPTPTAYLSSPFYLMIDYALGGGWPISGMVDGSSMDVDWVRVYSLPQ